MSKRQENIFASDINWDASIAFPLMVLSILFYCLFIAFSPLMHSIGKAVDITQLVPWNIPTGRDGIELYVMSIAMPIYLGLSYIIIKYVKYFSFCSSNKRTFVMYGIILSSLLIINLLWKEHVTFETTIISVIIGIISYFSYNIAKHQFLGFKLIILNASFFIVLFIIELFIYQPSMYDYCFIIGPVNKIIQGESLGTFYMQYNAIITFVFFVMQKCGLLFHEMHIVLTLIFVIWIFLYKQLVNKLFANKVLVFYFLLLFFIVKGMAMYGGAIGLPQESPLRMDLWVPLLLIVSFWGFDSFKTAIGFSLIYLCDDVFGFLYLVAYISIIGISVIQSISRRKPINKMDFICLIPLFFALIIHYSIFHSFMSAAGKIYADYHIGFLPIEQNSSFWLVVLLLPISLSIILKSKLKIKTIFFIYAITCIQLSYFFGRSHDNNLIQISGIFILLLFLVVDTLYTEKNKKRILVFTSICVGFIALTFGQSFSEKQVTVQRNISRGILNQLPIDSIIDDYKPYFKSLKNDKTIIISDIDSYLNYRYGFKQIGFFSPFLANFKIDNTTNFFKDELSQGHRLITAPIFWITMKQSINLFNKQLLSEHYKKIFYLDSLNNNLLEIKLGACK